MTPGPPDASPLAAAVTRDERRSAREERYRRLRPGTVRALGHPVGKSQPAQRTFLLQRAQPALSGLIDGSLSSLAPIFSVALATHTPRYAFYAGLATAIGAGVSMSFSEGLSDTGEDTGRGNPRVRGAITGAGTFIGGFLHTLPFLLSSYTTAIVVAILVALLVLGGMIAGLGQGLSFRAGLAAVNERAPAAQRAGVASSFFVVMYVAISLPVIGEGLLAQGVGLRAAGLTFAGVVAALSVTVLILLARTHRDDAGAGARSMVHAGSVR